MNKKILWITRTAILIALLIVMQGVTAPLGNPLITGSIVNLILIVSVMTCGINTGIPVAFISPICARLLGIGPQLWTLIPFIMVGNIVLVLIWHLIGNRKIGISKGGYIVALIVAALAKFLALYVGIVKIAIPMFLKLPEAKASAISNMFSIPQLITALIGGILAIMILPVIKPLVKNT